MTWCCSSLCQSIFTAPGMWPTSYNRMSSSDSTTRTVGSVRCSATQAVLTNTSGYTYSAIMFSSLIVAGLERDEAVRARGTGTDVAVEVEIEACIERHVIGAYVNDVDLVVAFRDDHATRGQVFNQ